MSVTMKEVKKKHRHIHVFGLLARTFTLAGFVWSGLALLCSSNYVVLNLVNMSVCAGLLGGFIISDRRLWPRMLKLENTLADLIRENDELTRRHAELVRENEEMES